MPDSIAPKIEDGDTVIITQDIFTKPGDIILAMINEEVTIKQLGKSGDLIPTNNHYKKIKSDGIRIIGKVVGMYKKF